MPLTPEQISLRRFGPPGSLRNVPRNPTSWERQQGAPALTSAEWAALRDWQRRTIRKWTYEPAAIERRKRALLELDTMAAAA